MTNTDTFPKSGKKERKKKLTQGGSNEPLNSSQKRGKVREFLRWSRYFEAMFSVSLKGGITLWVYFEPNKCEISKVINIDYKKKVNCHSWSAF